MAYKPTTRVIQAKPGIMIKMSTGRNPPHHKPVRTDLLPRGARVLLKELELMGEVGGGTVSARWDFSYEYKYANGSTAEGAASLTFHNGDWKLAAARGSKTRTYKNAETAIKHFYNWLKKGCPYGPIK